MIAETGVTGLTPAENLVMERLSCGLSNEQIAQELGVSGHTVRAHLRSIYKTLRVDNRLQAVLIWLAHQKGGK
jgi:DNA-binding NarL/FixJ family response regulator